MARCYVYIRRGYSINDLMSNACSSWNLREPKFPWRKSSGSNYKYGIGKPKSRCGQFNRISKLSSISKTCKTCPNQSSLHLWSVRSRCSRDWRIYEKWSYIPISFFSFFSQATRTNFKLKTIVLLFRRLFWYFNRTKYYTRVLRILEERRRFFENSTWNEITSTFQNIWRLWIF